MEVPHELTIAPMFLGCNVDAPKAGAFAQADAIWRDDASTPIDDDGEQNPNIVEVEFAEVSLSCDGGVIDFRQERLPGREGGPTCFYVPARCGQNFLHFCPIEHFSRTGGCVLARECIKRDFEIWLHSFWMIPLQPRNQLLNHGPRAVLRALGPFLAIQPSDVGAQDTAINVAHRLNRCAMLLQKAEPSAKRLEGAFPGFRAFVGMVLPEGK